MLVKAKWDARGEPTRITLMGVTPHEGAYVSALPGLYGGSSLPPEPITLATIERDYGRDALDPQVSAWLDQHRRANRASLQLARLPDADVPVDYGARLYPYQRVGAMWLAHAKRAILGDQVGLGKTLQALTAARLLSAQNVLIVTLNIAKRSVWQYHCEAWLQQPVTVAEGSHDQRAKLLKRRDPWMIVNHEMLRPGSKYPGLWDRTWDLVIVDEAHKFQGRGTKSAQSLGMERIRTESLFLLTGTPIWNDPESLWHLLRLLQPQRFSSYWRFIDEYFTTRQTPWTREITGVHPQKLDTLKAIIAPILLRRKKDDVNTQLPEKTRQTIAYNLAPIYRGAYHNLVKKRKLETPLGAKYYDSAAAALADARKLLNMPRAFGWQEESAKTHALLELLSTLDEKVVIFCWHVEYAEYLANLLRGKDMAVSVITGSTAPKARDNAIAQFVNPKGAQVLIGNIAAIGTAINDLVVARVAIFAEGSYTPVHNEQAEGRLHRTGQKSNVTIYRLQGTGTVEEALWELNDTRSDISNEILAFEELVKRVFGEAQ